MRTTLHPELRSASQAMETMACDCFAPSPRSKAAALQTAGTCASRHLTAQSFSRQAKECCAIGIAHPICMRNRTTYLMALLLASSMAHADTVRCPAKVTSMDMTKGEYSPLPGATFVLQNFSAIMTARGPSSPLCFNRITAIDHGQVFISSESLTHLFGQKI